MPECNFSSVNLVMGKYKKIFNTRGHLMSKELEFLEKDEEWDDEDDWDDDEDELWDELEDEEGLFDEEDIENWDDEDDDEDWDEDDEEEKIINRNYH